jgi:tRNA A37 methylthiotransferase MiaB
MENPKPLPDAPRAPKVSFVSLGCPKALVDSERIITHLRAEGYELARAHAGADLVVVNTCGFLDSAQAESLAAIGQAMQDNGKVIVTGCMGAEPETITARYPASSPSPDPSNTKASSRPCTARCRRGMIRFSTSCRPKASSLRPGTTPI